MDDPSNRSPGGPPGAPHAPGAAHDPYAHVPYAHDPYAQHPYATGPLPPVHAPPRLPAHDPYAQQPYAQPYAQQPYAPVPPPVVHAPVPVVTVQVSNVLVPAGPMPPAPPVMAPMHAPPAYAPPPARPANPGANPGVVAMMRDDAAQRTMEAVARRGPARVLAHGVGAIALCGATALFASLAFGTSVSGVLLGALPLLVLAALAFVVGARAGRGVASHHLEQAILGLAADNGGLVRVVALAQVTGRPLRECQLAIDAMVASGHATVEADDSGGLLYRVPDLEPRRRNAPIEATVIGPGDGGAV